MNAMIKKPRINRLEAYIAPNSKIKLDGLQQSLGLKQGAMISELILSLTDRDVEAFSPSKKSLIDTDISTEANARWIELESKFGRRASKSKLLEIAISKL
jgi:hypothetical protein